MSRKYKSRIEQCFAALRGERAALIAYLTGGFPGVTACLEIASRLISQADMLELGIPFSDPVMDGPVIQETSRLSLERGCGVEECLGLAAELRRGTEKPLLLMSYYNPVFRYGLEGFAAAARASGVDGVIVPDLPPEEMDEWGKTASKHGLDTPLFISPNTPQERIRIISEKASGFLYCVTTMGVTGLRPTLDSGLSSLIARARSCARLPLAVGVGVSSPQQCGEAGKMADGVIVGSAFMRAALDALERGESPAAMVEHLAWRMRRSLEEILPQTGEFTI